MKKLINVAIIFSLCMLIATTLVVLSSFKQHKEKAYIFSESETSYMITTLNTAKQIIIHSHEVPMATGVDMVNRIDSISRIVIKQLDSKDSIEVK